MPFWLLSFPLYCLFFVLPALSESIQQAFFPASIPLANRSPYLSAWLNSTVTSPPLTHIWPTFWDQRSILGWAGRIRVDNVTYQWMGQDILPPFIGNITNIRITPTRSIFVMQAGPMNVTVTFLSPIEPSDWVLQSLPFSYVSVEASTLDGQAHDVQIYSDITTEWLSGDRQDVVIWNQQTYMGSMYHEIQLQSPKMDVESANQQAQDGTAYYGIANRPGLTWEIGTSGPVRHQQFSDLGNLTNTASIKFGPIQAFVSFAFAVDLGQIQRTEEPVAWVVGYVRDPSIAYTSPDSSVQQLSPYFVTKYGFDNVATAIDDFTSGLNDTLARAVAYDDALIANASTVSPHYADLVSLVIRQTLSTLDITVSKGLDGNPNASDVRIFMKDIGATTPTARVSPVERIYAALPALLYANASMLGSLLAPLLEAQDGPSATPYAAQDLGLAYPNATGASGPHRRGVEQSGNMLIMLYAHARFSGDGSLIQKYYNLAKRWVDYLVNNTLAPVNQLSADNEGTANMTNLAIKGIIGVRAMAEISHTLGEESDAERYNDSATSLMGQWQSLALSSDQQHLLGTYGNQGSWALMYNLYADRLLGFNLVNQAVLQGQTAFYKNLLSTAPAFGLPRDSTSVSETNIAWLLFTAAIVQDDSVRGGLVDNAWTRASSNATTGVFPDRYDVNTGAVLEGSAGAAVGGIFSLLTLNLPVKDIVVPPANRHVPGGTVTTTPSGGGHSSKIGAIAGGIVGGVAGATVVVIGVLCCLRKRRRDNSSRHAATETPPQPTLPYTDCPPDMCLASCDTTGVQLGSGTPQTQLSSTHPSGRSRKAQEAARDNTPSSLTAVSHPTDDPFTSSPNEVLARACELPSEEALPHGASVASLTPTDVLHLRTEVENLRQVIQEIQEERLEPPPEYGSG